MMLLFCAGFAGGMALSVSSSEYPYGSPMHTLNSNYYDSLCTGLETSLLECVTIQPPTRETCSHRSIFKAKCFKTLEGTLKMD